MVYNYQQQLPKFSKCVYLNSPFTLNTNKIEPTHQKSVCLAKRNSSVAMLTEKRKFLATNVYLLLNLFG